MSPELGPIHLADDDEPVFLGRDIGRRSQTSDATAEIVDREVRRIIDTGYENAKKLISDNRRSSTSWPRTSCVTRSSPVRRSMA